MLIRRGESASLSTFRCRSKFGMTFLFKLSSNNSFLVLDKAIVSLYYCNNK